MQEIKRMNDILNEAEKSVKRIQDFSNDLSNLSKNISSLESKIESQGEKSGDVSMSEIKKIASYVVKKSEESIVAFEGRMKMFLIGLGVMNIITLLIVLIKG